MDISKYKILNLLNCCEINNKKLNKHTIKLDKHTIADKPTGWHILNQNTSTIKKVICTWCRKLFVLGARMWFIDLFILVILV